VSVEKILGRLVPRFKLWLEIDGETVLGKGGALLLRRIDELGSISQAVSNLPTGNMREEVAGEVGVPSYRFAWGYLRKVEERLGAAIVRKRRGRRGSRGGTVLTPLGRALLEKYEELEAKLNAAISTSMEDLGRNTSVDEA